MAKKGFEWAGELNKAGEAAGKDEKLALNLHGTGQTVGT